MRNAIITSTNRRGSCESTSVMVHARNALTLSKALDLVLIEGEEDAYKLAIPYDNIICNYASFYMPWKAYFDKIMAQPSARLWWMVNDHDVEDNVLLRNILKATDCKRTYGVISNNSREGFRQWILRKWIVKDKVRLNDCIDSWHTINLNALTFENHIADRNKIFQYALCPFVYPAIYWGSWRKWRAPYFLKYSHPDIFFSTSTKNKKKLEAIGCQNTFIDKITWGEDSALARANATVYLEDPHSHTNFAFPANRFYEALSYGVNIAIDESCRQNAEQFGYKDLTYINSPNELLELGKKWKQVPDEWLLRATNEKYHALFQIKELLT